MLSDVRLAHLSVLSSLAAAALWLGACTGQNNPIKEMMSEFSPPTPGEVARDAFNVYDADKRRNSVAMLSASPFGGEEPYLRLYRLLVDDPDATVRAACAKALGLHGSVEDVPLLLRRLGDDVAFVRWEAAVALQRVHSEDAVMPLMDSATKDPDADVRQAAALALGQYATPAVFGALVRALDDPDFSVAASARRSLCTLTGQDFGMDATNWLEWARQNDGRLFAHQQQYVWHPFEKPRGVLDKAQFWKKHQPVSPQVPRGLDAAETDS